MLGRAARKSRPRLTLFWATLSACAAIAVLGILFPEATGGMATAITGVAFRALDWFFMAIASAALFLCLGLALSKYGTIRLGEEEPEFSTISWLSMLFAAGMGTGLLFWGVAEPLTHFAGSPGVEGGTAEAANHALVMTSLHWGLHAWGLYGIAALILAYFGFRKRTRYLPSAPLTHTFRGLWTKPVAIGADGLAVIAVAFGVAGSVAMGTLQLSAGVSIAGGTAPDSLSVQLVILGLLVIAYMASATTGIEKGIKWLSNINMVIATLLMLFLLLAGPTSSLLRGFFTLVGDYLSQLVSLSLRLYPYDEARDWVSSWTLTYFVWWIAWCPFVGVFIARISRGRTIREFVVGVLVAPTVFSLLWFAIFGGIGIHEEMARGGLLDLVREDLTLALFSLYGRLPLSLLLTLCSLCLVFIFLVTSVDSATFVLGMMTSQGSLNPSATQKLAWGLALGLLSAALMLSGQIDVVRALAIVGAIPFTFVLALQTAALLRNLFAEKRAGIFDRKSQE